MVGHRLVPQLGSEGVVGQALGVLAQAVPIESLDGRRDRRVNRASAVLQEAAVRHLVRERMLERVLRIGETARLVEELGGPKGRVSTRVRTLSSRKNGFPSARSMRSRPSGWRATSSPKSARSTLLAPSGGKGSIGNWV